MRVTGIETTKKGRYALMVDGEFAFSLHRDTFLLCPWLQKGAEVSPERLETLRQEELLALIRKKYAKNMADRAGMEKTIAALYRRGYPLEEIKAAMNTILEQEENCRDD